MNRVNWWKHIGDDATPLQETWIVVGLPGHAGTAKQRRKELLDARFGPDGWRHAHVVRGQIVPPSVAIVEYEESYRRFLRERPALVRFVATACGNVYDFDVSNVYDDDYEQPNSVANHYQDISVRRVMAELAADPAWPDVSPTPAEEAELQDFGSGEVHVLPRAQGFRGAHLLQIRDPFSPGFMLNPAVVPAWDPALVTGGPRRTEWYDNEGCGPLSVEAFWQMSKVVEVRYDRFLALADRARPLDGI